MLNLLGRMKYIIASAAIVASISIASSAFASSPMESVFKITSYQYDDQADSYTEYAYGSAVYAGNGIIYTNAHVIMGDDEKPLGNYRVCKTTNFKKAPECFSVGKLLSYDVKNDLATLSIENIKTPAVKMLTSPMKMGSEIQVYGYPANGGNTISFTEGKISGFESELYKIDANIDSGNSGGGVFDAKGNLIGMTVSVRTGYSSMGYIIPVSTIQKYIAKKTDAIKVYSEKADADFIAFDKKYRTLWKNTSFSIPDLTIKSVRTAGFTLSNYEVSKNGALYSAELKGADTSIDIRNYQYFGSHRVTIAQWLKSEKLSEEKIVKNNKEMQVSIQELTINGKKAISCTYSIKKFKATEFIIEQGNNSFLKIVLSTSNPTGKEFSKAVALITKNTAIKSKPAISSGDGTLRVHTISMPDNGIFNIEKSIEKNQIIAMSDVSFDILVQGSRMSEKLEEFKDVSFESIAKRTRNGYKDLRYVNEISLKKTASGDPYLYVFIKNNEDSSDGTIDSSEQTYKILSVFFDTNASKGTGQRYDFSFSFFDKSSKKLVDDLLFNMKTSSGKSPIPNGNMSLGDNLITTPEFQF